MLAFGQQLQNPDAGRMCKGLEELSLDLVQRPAHRTPPRPTCSGLAKRGGASHPSPEQYRTRSAAIASECPTAGTAADISGAYRQRIYG
jgi:hypothetical protein